AVGYDLQVAEVGGIEARRAEDRLVGDDRLLRRSAGEAGDHLLVERADQHQARLAAVVERILDRVLEQRLAERADVAGGAVGGRRGGGGRIGAVGPARA